MLFGSSCGSLKVCCVIWIFRLGTDHRMRNIESSSFQCRFMNPRFRTKVGRIALWMESDIYATPLSSVSPS